MIKRVAACLALLLLCACPAARGEETPREPLEERALACFFESAFGAEYGGVPRLTRWQGELIVCARGAYTPEDIHQLDAVLASLSALPGLPPMRRTEDASAANVIYTFAPLRELGEHVEGYVEGWGFATWWFERCVITRARAAVACDVTTQAERDHIILEELVNALGLGRDLDNAPDSVISQSRHGARTLGALDEAMLRLLYDPRLSPGMTADEARAALSEYEPE